MLTMLGQGFVVTLQIFFLTLLGSLPLGVLVALGRMSRVKPLAWLIRLYISVMRGTPLMLQMFFIYFLGLFVSKVYMERKKRPIYIVKKKGGFTST